MPNERSIENPPSNRPNTSTGLNRARAAGSHSPDDPQGEPSTANTASSPNPEYAPRATDEVDHSGSTLEGRSVRAVMKTIRHALVARDLRGPRPSLLPLGPRARRRRARRHQVLTEARRRRQHLHHLLYDGPNSDTPSSQAMSAQLTPPESPAEEPTEQDYALVSASRPRDPSDTTPDAQLSMAAATAAPSDSDRSRPATSDISAHPPPRQRLLVIGGLVAAVSLVVTVAIVASHAPNPTLDPSGADANVAAPSSSPVTGPTPAQGSGTSADVDGPGLAPIPRDGVTPRVPGGAGTAANGGSPGDVAGLELVPTPPHEPTAAELATPESAMRAWLSRWCPFHYADDFGTSERRARAAMTTDGWRSVDPFRSAPARSSWERTVAARETGRCAAPRAHVAPGAPRTDADSIVIGSIDRFVTPDPSPAATPGPDPGVSSDGDSAGGYVESVSVVHVVRRDPGGLWRVDLPTAGG